MKVKIIRGNKNYWYKDKVGKIFDMHSITNKVIYEAFYKGDYIGGVNKEDCEIIMTNNEVIQSYNDKSCMTKDDLKTGYVVQARNGKYFLVMKNTFDGDGLICFNSDDNYNFSHMPLRFYKDDLSYMYDEEYDIIKVLKGNYLGNTIRLLVNCEYDKLEVIYEEPPAQKFALKEELDKLLQKESELHTQIDALKKEIERM